MTNAIIRFMSQEFDSSGKIQARIDAFSQSLGTLPGLGHTDSLVEASDTFLALAGVRVSPKTDKQLIRNLRNTPAPLYVTDRGSTPGFTQHSPEHLEALLRPLAYEALAINFPDRGIDEGDVEAELESALGSLQWYLQRTFGDAYTYRKAVRMAIERDKQVNPDNARREEWLQGAIAFGLEVYGQGQWQSVDAYCASTSDELAQVEGLA